MTNNLFQTWCWKKKEKYHYSVREMSSPPLYVDLSILSKDFTKRYIKSSIGQMYTKIGNILNHSWHDHEPKTLLNNNEEKILWHVVILQNHVTEERADIEVTAKKGMVCIV